MTIAYRLDGALLPFQSVRFNPDAEAIFPAAAWYGEPVVAGVIIEDTNGTLDIDGWHTFTVEETACSKPRIFTGWIAGKEISRGRDSNRAGVARVWNCDIVDSNAIFSFEVFRSSAASIRPAETDVARVQAVIASHAMGGTPIADNGRLSTDNPRNLDAANFVTQYPAQALYSTAGQCAKNYYSYWDDAAREISIHYDAVGDGPAATITFSNVPGDYGPIESASTTCFAPSRDATLSQDPYNLYTGFLLGWAGGYTYERNDTLIDTLSPTEFSPVNFLRDQFEQSSRIGRSSTASSYTASQLARYGVEKVTLNFTATLPARAVNLAHAGDIVTVRFSHLPGYTSNTEVSIIRRSVRPVDGHDALYEVTFECADFEGAEVGGGPPGVFFPPGDCDPDEISVVSASVVAVSVVPDITIGVTPAVGQTLIVWETPRSTGTVITWPGFTDAGPGYIDAADPGLHGAMHARMLYRHIESGDTATFPLTVVGSDPGIGVHYALYDAVLTPTGNYAATQLADDGCSPPAVQSLGTVTPSANGILHAAEVVRTDVTDTFSITYDNADFTELTDPGSYGSPLLNGSSGWAVAHTGGPAEVCDVTWTYIGCHHGGVAAVVEFACGTGDPDELPACPSTGMWTDWFLHAEGDGTTSQFTLDCPYADGALLVKVDGLEITLGLTETDPETGVFDLDFAPKAAQGDAPAEQVWVKYMGR